MSAYTNCNAQMCARGKYYEYGIRYVLLGLMYLEGGTWYSPAVCGRVIVNNKSGVTCNSSKQFLVT